MNSDDYVYLFFLFFSIVFGFYYRKIENVQKKKTVGALVGLVIVIIVSKLHVIHIFIIILVNSIFILHIDKRYCHIISFIFSFIYLIFFRSTVYFGIPYPPNHTNLVQMILTLKLVGLAYEVNVRHTNIRKKSDTDVSVLTQAENLNVGYLDIFCYGINYIGVLTGPYYKYQTYIDHLNQPFYKFDDYKSATKHKILPLLPIFAAVFLLTDFLWPLSYVSTVQFDQRSWLYRYWYIWPTFLNFRMRIYIGLIMSECVCIMGGLGVYPEKCRSEPGNGPTQNLDLLESSSSDLETLKYDYKTVYNINTYGTEFYPTLREGMRNWNITVQYWLAMCVYKRFPSKRFRTFATMFVSGVWHGVYSGYYISVGMIPFGLILEDIWAQILLKDDFFLPRKIGYILMLFLKMQYFSYAALAFSLLYVDKCIHYYNSVYHWMVWFCIILYILGRKLLKLKKKSITANQQKNE